MNVTKSSNSDEKISRDLVVAFARELSELTGETPSCLHQWGEDLGLPVRARQTFYSDLRRGEWERGSEKTLTQDCRMGSYPMSCQLRLRAVSLVTQFSRDKREGKKRQLIILLGYEVCSKLLNFQIYRGDDVEIGEHEKVHGIELCTRLPATTVAAFVEKCGRMVGLPLQSVLFTHDLMGFSGPKSGVALLSLTSGEVTVRKQREDADDNEVLCNYGTKLPGQISPYSTLTGEHPFIEWCGTTNATALTATLSELVKRHNKATALPRLESAQQALDSLLKKFHEAAEARHARSQWTTTVPPSPFQIRLMKHDYALERLPLREVRFHKWTYEDYKKFPGDCLPVAEIPGDTATRRP